MLSPRVLTSMLAMAALGSSSLLPAVVVLHPAPAVAQPAANFRVGMRLKAKRACTVNGYAIKKGVVLTIVAVHKNDQGKASAVDMSFSGMTISGVDVKTVNQNFSRA